MLSGKAQKAQKITPAFNITSASPGTLLLTHPKTRVIVSFVCENLSQKKRDEDGFQYVVKV